MQTYEEILDEMEPSLKFPVEKTNEGWFFKAEQEPVFRLADSWAGHQDLPMGLDLSEVA
jgi:hypothetical protein